MHPAGLTAVTPRRVLIKEMEAGREGWRKNVGGGGEQEVNSKGDGRKDSEDGRGWRG